MTFDVSRRSLLEMGLLGGGSILGKFLPREALAQNLQQHNSQVTGSVVHGGSITVGDVDNDRNGFNPRDILTDWDGGKVSQLSNGKTLREYDIAVEEREIEIAPGVFYPAWTYNGRVPGSTLRVTEGDRVKINFRNKSRHPHTIHFHGIHSARQDGVPGTLEAMPGEEVVYDFDAKPFGCHLYHCHSAPFKRHLHKGLYGAFIIDPDPKRHPEAEQQARSRLLGSSENKQWQEFLMVMNAFDTNFDEENEFYAVNTIHPEFMKRPLRI